ncbi:spore coat protein CotJB [Eubacteriales bacterium OttesenSCG-928-M02]|nr:spore coat protein CotJB [Eubacteriales bacterium OttesenSCG-928-M02]
MKREQRQLFWQLEMAGFVLDDVRLYLDTHPQDKDALAYHQEYQMIKDGIVEEYEALYGPMTSAGVRPGEEWSWARGPWPWEREAN